MLRLPDGHLAARTDFFEQLGISARLPLTARVQRDYYDLDSLPELDYAVDQCRQTLSVDAARLKAATNVSLRHRVTDTGDTPPLRPGGFAQIDAQYVDADGNSALSVLASAGVFAGGSQFESDALLDEHNAVRLETAWTMPSPTRLNRLSIGDSITRPGPSGSARRFGGIQWGTDFSLQPNLVTFPLPATRGLATLPSTVDVYINDVLRGRSPVDAGPFELTDLSGITGDGRVRLVVTDLLGRSQVLEYDIYTAPQLLRAGLSEYSLAAGFDRRQFGIRSNDYGAGFVSALYRRGLDNRMTLDSQLEVGDGRAIAAAGYTLMIADLGIVGASLAQGAGDSSGGQMRLSAERIGPVWSLRGEWQRTSRGFLRIGEDRPSSLRRSLAGLSWRDPRAGSVSLNWIDDLTGDRDHFQSIALGYTPREWAGFYFALSASYDLEDADRHSALMLVSRTLGNRVHASANLQTRRSGTTAGLQLSRHSRGPLGWQSQAGVTRGELSRVYAGTAYTDPHGSVSAEVEDFENQQAYRVGLRSGVVALGSDWFWTRPLSGPFAVVDTGSITDVGVFSENHFVGRTDHRGLLLVPDLRPHESNRLAIADEHFAVDARIERFATQVAPGSYGGVRVDFRAQPGVGRRIRLRLDNGSAPPAGADLRVRETGEETFVGFDGNAVLNGAPGRYRIEVRWSGGSCIAEARLHSDSRLAQPAAELPCGTVRSESDERTGNR